MPSVWPSAVSRKRPTTPPSTRAPPGAANAAPRHRTRYSTGSSIRFVAQRRFGANRDSAACCAPLFLFHETKPRVGRRVSVSFSRGFVSNSWFLLCECFEFPLCIFCYCSLSCCHYSAVCDSSSRFALLLQIELRGLSVYFFTTVSLAETAEPIDTHLKQLVVDSRHGTGSLGHRVNGSFGSSFTSGSPGHHFDPV